jgi:hypothetical protein
MSVRTFAAMSFAAALMLVLAGAAHAAGSSHSGTTFGAHAAATSNGRHALDRDKGLARAEDRRDRHGHHRDRDRKHKVKAGLKLHPAAPPPVNRN